ncbi:MAG: hypothetical protein ACQESX_07535 [Bacteroidota bacterium]
MKKTGIALVFGFLLFSQSCDEVDELLTFTIKNQTELEIENQIPVDTPFNVPTPDINSQSSQTFESNNTAASMVKEITLEKLELSIVSPDDFTFSFLKSIEIYISAGDEEQVMIASKDNIPEDAAVVDMDTQSENLRPYLIQDTYDLDFKVVTREAFAQDITLRADMEYKVKADPL